MTTLTDDAVRELHENAILIDGRDPTFLLYRTTGDEKEPYWDAVKQSGLTAITVDVPQVEDGFRDAALSFAAWRERSERHNAIIVNTTDDIRRAKEAGKTGFVLSSQTPTPIENDLRLIAALHSLGLRAVQMSYQKRNLLADGCGEENDAGLSNFGVDAVAELNRVGIAIDLSHASDRTMDQTIDLSSRPVYFSHSNARALADHPRNVPNTTLKMLADRGGVCCISAYSDFLKEGGSEHGTTLDDYIKMVTYVVELIGIDHVGMGFDVGELRNDREMGLIGGRPSPTRYVTELRSRSDLIKLTHALAGAGFTAKEMEAFLGGNLLRFYNEAWHQTGATH